jgi:DNA-binding response OmpR family regulator
MIFGLNFAKENNTMKKPKRIILIDDEAVIGFGFTKVLKDQNVEVDFAQSAEEAMTFLSRHSYEAAIVDLRLSNSTKMEGFDCVRYLRLNQKKCRIIVLTAYGDNGTWEKSEDLGVDLFLEKPIEPEIIRKTLETFGIYDY